MAKNLLYKTQFISWKGFLCKILELYLVKKFKMDLQTTLQERGLAQEAGKKLNVARQLASVWFRQAPAADGKPSPSPICCLKVF